MSFVASVTLMVATMLAAGAVLSQASAQMPPGMEQVSGKYVNEDAGVEVTFPDEWSGFEMEGSFGTLVAISPGGMSESDPETMKTISLIISDKSQNRDPSDPSSFSQDVDDCNDPSIKSRTVAGVQGIEATIDCPDTSQKFRMVAVETSSNWIAVMYMAPSADFDSELASFDSAVSSLKVQGAVDTEGPSDGGDGGQTGSPATSMMSVMVQGEPIDVSVRSSSTISDFELDEGAKALSFKTEGTGTETVIAIGSVLEGPFTVMVDGQVVQAQESEEEGVNTITIPHSSGAHDVTVSGTQVVPEFPVAALGAIAAAIGTVTVISRTRMFKPS